jgi:hypothetical protein
VTWSAVGIDQGENSTNLTLSNQGIGNLIVAEVINFSGSGVWSTGFTGGGVTWVPAGVKFSGSTNAFSAAVFLGTVTATGAQTATVTWSGTAPASFGIASREFHSTVGQWTFITQGNLDSSGTASFPSLNAAAGDLYFGYAANNSAATSGSTSGYVYDASADSAGNGQAFNVNCPSGATFPVWGDSGQALGIAILVREGGPAAPVIAQALQPVPPGWFPGADAVTVQPDGIPFWAQPQPTDATPAIIIPPFPEAAAHPIPLLPPGWFPGADRVTTEPGGIPFLQQPAPADPSKAVLPPAAPDILGIQDWLPLPPGWFPGAALVTTDPGSIPFYSLPQPQIPATPPPPPPVITGLGGSGYSRWFTDQNGSPRLAVIEQAWALPFNAGRWNSGNWQADFTAYFLNRSVQGYTAMYGVAWGSTHVDSTALTGGRSWDGVYALTVNGTPGAIATGAETVGINPAFWARIDAMFTTARQFGIACFLNMGLTYDRSDAGAIWQNATNAQAQAFGAALAARYPQSQYPNVQWFFGDDDGGGNDSFWAAMLTGMQSAGDTRTLLAIEYETNSNSHVEYDNGAPIGTFGAANAGYNWVYSYDAPYFGVERSYTEGGTFQRIPPVYGDGIYYGDSGGGPSVETAVRTFVWWALSSGSRGFASTSGPSFADPGALWIWQSAAAGRLTSDPNGSWTTSKVGQVAAYFSGLTDWYRLIPDTGNTFIVSGRGTRGTCDPPNSGFNVRTGSTYVSGSITPNGTLAIAYCRASMSITIDQTRLGNGYTATWVDPSSLATQSAGTGATYNSAGLGNNSAGQPDWVLVFQGPAVPALPAPGAPVIPLAPGWFPGADRVTAVPGGVPFAQPPADPSGVVAATAVSPAAGLAAGTGAALPPLAAVGANGALAAGTGTALSPLAAAAANATAAAGTGAAPAPVAAIAVFAAVAAAAAVAPQPSVTISGSTNAPAGVATATAVALAPAVAIAVNAAVATATGTAPAAAPADGATPAAATAAGTALAPVAAITVSAAVASASGVATQATVNTSGNTNAVAAVASAAGVALAPVAAVTVNAAVATAAGVAPAATGQASRLASAGIAAAAGVALAPALTLATSAHAAAAAALAQALPANAVSVLPFTVGTLTAASAPAATLTAATAPGGTAGGTITSGTQRTGGPS